MVFTITETTFETLPALTVEGAHARLIVTLRGVTIIDWSVDGVKLIDGYANEREFAEQAGMRSALMIPFSNRIDAGRYSFDGRQIDFHANDPVRAGEIVMHGMLRLEDFTITGIETGDACAVISFVCHALRPERFPGYPFSIDVSVDLTIAETGLKFVITGNNLGDKAAPFACGWHPYFIIGSAPISSLTVSIPAETRIVPDSRLIPIAGDGAFEPVSREWDFRSGRPLGCQAIDMAFGGLVPASDGLIHSTLADPKTGRTIDAWQERGLMHLFTADTVPRPRGSVAMEPVEVMTNAANRPDQADAIRLEPGARRTFRFGASTYQT